MSNYNSCHTLFPNCSFWGNYVFDQMRETRRVDLQVIISNAGVGEWLKSAVLKTCGSQSGSMFSTIRHASGGFGAELDNDLGNR
jgi:hypothetical protein